MTERLIVVALILTGFNSETIRDKSCRIEPATMDAYFSMRIPNAPLVTVPVTDKSIVIDGKLNEDAWKQAKELGPLKRLKGKRGKFRGNKADDTFIRLISDRKNLYIAGICFEKDMSKLVANASDDDGLLWNDDCVEIFIDPYFVRNGHAHLIVNPKAARYDAWVDYTKSNAKKVTLSWNPEWTVATNQLTDKWIIEVKIPFSSFGNNISDLWSVNFAREQARNTGWCCWAPVINLFHDDKHYGMLAFGNHPQILPRQILISSLAIGKNHINLTLQNTTKQDISAIIKAQVRGEYLASRKVNFKPCESEKIGLSVKLDASMMGKRLRLLALDPKTNDSGFCFSSIEIPTRKIISVSAKPELIIRGEPLSILIETNLSKDEVFHCEIIVNICNSAGKSVFHQSLKQLESPTFHLILSTDKMPQDKYSIETKIVSMKAKAKATFEIIPTPFDDLSF